MDSLSIVIPAFNEESRLVPTLLAIDRYMKQRNSALEVLVVDDGSTDRTAELVRDFARGCPFVRVLENGRNRGKGYSVRRGVKEASGEIILISDADLPVPIEQSERLIEAIDAGAAIAIGSRTLNQQLQKIRPPIHRRICSLCFQTLVRLLLGLNFKDTQCGFKALAREPARKIFAKLTIDEWAFDPEILVLADLLGYRVAEIPVETYHSAGSKVRLLRDSLRMFKDLLAIRRTVYAQPGEVRGEATSPVLSISGEEPDQIKAA